MKLFCREDHSKPIDIQVNIEDELLQARARLAKLKKLPESAFVSKSTRSVSFSSFNGQPFTYAVDNKDDAIAKQEAKIAELEILVPAKSKKEGEK